MGLLQGFVFAVSVTAAAAQFSCPAAPAAQWTTAKDANNRFQFQLNGVNQVLRGISMTGMETGTRMTAAGAGYWLFQAQSENLANSKAVIENVVTTLVQTWKANIVRVPICGSAWLQNYQVQGWGGPLGITSRQWVDIAVCKALSLGAAVILDNHLWAIAPQTSTTRNVGMEDGCTGINKVGGTDSCAPRDFYGAYSSARTGKSYNTGDAANVWQCAIANADGCTLDNLLRTGSNGVPNSEHFLNLWYDLAVYYKSQSGVFFELFNEPYQRLAAQPGSSFGDNIEESQYNWAGWAALHDSVIQVIRGAAQSNNIVIVSALDWAYDYEGKGGASTGGPIARPNDILPWATRATPATNVAYSFHPYQHGSCCGQIGSTSDLSISDPYQSAFCLYPPSGSASYGALPVPGGVSCDSTGYGGTVDKKSPPCVWVPQAKKTSSSAPGLCAGDRSVCGALTEAQCRAVDASQPTAGGWSTYVLPMQAYGPLIATEHGTFDCSSPYETALLAWMRAYDVSYTAWALWPQNSGGPGSGACGYPSVMVPPAQGSDAFGKGGAGQNCADLASCKTFLQPLPWAGKVIFADLQLGGNAVPASPSPAGAAVTPSPTRTASASKSVGASASATPSPTASPSASLSRGASPSNTASPSSSPGVAAANGASSGAAGSGGGPLLPTSSGATPSTTSAGATAGIAIFILLAVALSAAYFGARALKRGYSYSGHAVVSGGGASDADWGRGQVPSQGPLAAPAAVVRTTEMATRSGGSKGADRDRVAFNPVHSGGSHSAGGVAKAAAHAAAMDSDATTANPLTLGEGGAGGAGVGAAAAGRLGSIAPHKQHAAAGGPGSASVFATNQPLRRVLYTTNACLGFLTALFLAAGAFLPWFVLVSGPGITPSIVSATGLIRATGCVASACTTAMVDDIAFNAAFAALVLAFLAACTLFFTALIAVVNVSRVIKGKGRAPSCVSCPIGGLSFICSLLPLFLAIVAAILPTHSLAGPLSTASLGAGPGLVAIAIVQSLLSVALSLVLWRIKPRLVG